MRLLTAHRPTERKVYPKEKYKAQGLIKVCLKFYDKAYKRFAVKIFNFNSEALDHACALHTDVLCACMIVTCEALACRSFCLEGASVTMDKEAQSLLYSTFFIILKVVEYLYY